MGTWIMLAILLLVSIWVVYVVAGAEYLEEKSQTRTQQKDPAGDTSIKSGDEDVVTKGDAREARSYGLRVVIGVLIVTIAVPLLLVVTGLEWIAAIPGIVLLGPIALIGLLVWYAVASGMN